MLFRYSCERLLTVLGLRDLIIGWGKHVADDLATILVDPRPPECACSCRGLHLPLDDNWKREGKCGALARLRLDPNSSAVHLDDTDCDQFSFLGLTVTGWRDGSIKSTDHMATMD